MAPVSAPQSKHFNFPPQMPVRCCPHCGAPVQLVTRGDNWETVCTKDCTKKAVATCHKVRRDWQMSIGVQA